MLSAPSDNQKMLRQINKGKMQNVFKQNQSQELQIVPLSSELKENNQQYSPNKQKIKDQLSHINDQFKHIKNKTFNTNKWDLFAPYSFPKLSSQQKDNVFQSLFQDYKSMKVQHNEYVQKYLKLHVKLHKLQAEISKFNKNNRLTPAQKRQLHKSNDQQNRQMKQQIKRLRQKIQVLTSNVKPVQKNKPSSANKTFSNTQKAIFPVNENIKAELQLQRKHVKQLLQVIDDFKRNKMILQSELKERNFNKGLQNNEVSRAGIKKVGRSNLDNQSKFKQYSNELLMWKQKYHDMQMCFNKMNEDKDKIIRQINQELIDIKQAQRMRKNLQRNNNRPNFMGFGDQQRIRQLEDMNERLEKQLKELARNPLFKDNTQSIEVKKKNNDLEAKLQKLNQQNIKIKQEKIKYFTQLEVKSKQLTSIKSQNQKLKKQLKEHMEKDIKSSNKANSTYKYDQNDYYRKLLNLVKLEGDDPVWKKYADMSSPVFSIMTQTQLKQLAQKLWHNKLQLLAHLQKAQVQLKSFRQTNDSKVGSYLRQKQNLQEQLRIARARLDEWMSMDRVHGVKKDFQIFQSKGLKFNDSISVFEDDEDEIKALDPNQNFFDLFLGQLNLDQTNILRHPQNKIKSISNIISFLTIDFYNHATQHSNFSQGVSKKLLNNFSFKVQVNSYFMKFLTKNSICIQLWSPQGTSTILFGKGQIWLNDLLNPTAKDVSNVIRGKCPIYSINKVLLATVEYRVRMRLPISQFLQWANTKQNINKHSKIGDPFAINHRKKLAITVQRAQGLQSRSNAFVYFNIQNQDFFTQPELGSSPFWDYHRQIDVILDEQFCSYLKENYIQFTIFDDDKQVNEDVVGTAKANLTSLLQNNQPLDLNLQIQNSNFQQVGKLKIKANWV